MKYFKNIYNKYFCFCKGKYCLNHISQDCKYYFYLVIIDNNQHLYNKTHYLLADFFVTKKSSEDAYPVFKEMIKQNLNAHYMTAKINIYNKFCNYQENCLKVLKINDNNVNIDGDFLENYLEIVLKLKVVISGAEFFSKTNIFYNIKYITYLTTTHGLCYFKSFLFKSYISYRKFNKILIPPSETFINIAKSYGWKDENIIKIGLPKWDKYNTLEGKKIIEKSIFIMFTWRELKKSNKKISKHYLRNCIRLLENSRLLKVLKINKIIVYIAFHHRISSGLYRHFKRYNNKKKINLINLIDQDDISTVIEKTNLIISDFSSVIFELIYRRKPIIIYIPDGDDPNIINLYKQEYYDIINGLKNDSIYFENKIFNIENVVDKVIDYIGNNFKLEKKLEEFYDYLGLKGQNNTMKFIEYIKKL